jgi:hypothetical protein
MPKRKKITERQVEGSGKRHKKSGQMLFRYYYDDDTPGKMLLCVHRKEICSCKECSPTHIAKKRGKKGQEIEGVMWRARAVTKISSDSESTTHALLNNKVKYIF